MRLCLMIEGQEDVSWEQWCALAEACDAAGLVGILAQADVARDADETLVGETVEQISQ